MSTDQLDITIQDKHINTMSTDISKDVEKAITTALGVKVNKGAKDEINTLIVSLLRQLLNKKIKGDGSTDNSKELEGLRKDFERILTNLNKRTVKDNNGTPLLDKESIRKLSSDLTAKVSSDLPKNLNTTVKSLVNTVRELTSATKKVATAVEAIGKIKESGNVELTEAKEILKASREVAQHAKKSYEEAKKAKQYAIESYKNTKETSANINNSVKTLTDKVSKSVTDVKGTDSKVIANIIGREINKAITNSPELRNTAIGRVGKIESAKDIDRLVDAIKEMGTSGNISDMPIKEFARVIKALNDIRVLINDFMQGNRGNTLPAIDNKSIDKLNTLNNSINKLAAILDVVYKPDESSLKEVRQKLKEVVPTIDVDMQLNEDGVYEAVKKATKGGQDIADKTPILLPIGIDSERDFDKKLNAIKRECEKVIGTVEAQVNIEMPQSDKTKVEKAFNNFKKNITTSSLPIAADRLRSVVDETFPASSSEVKSAIKDSVGIILSLFNDIEDGFSKTGMSASKVMTKLNSILENIYTSADAIDKSRSNVPSARFAGQYYRHLDKTDTLTSLSSMRSAKSAQAEKVTLDIKDLDTSTIRNDDFKRSMEGLSRSLADLQKQIKDSLESGLARYGKGWKIVRDSKDQPLNEYFTPTKARGGAPGRQYKIDIANVGRMMRELSGAKINVSDNAESSEVLSLYKNLKTTKIANHYRSKGPQKMPELIGAWLNEVSSADILSTSGISPTLKGNLQTLKNKISKQGIDDGIIKEITGLLGDPKNMESVFRATYASREADKEIKNSGVVKSVAIPKAEINKYTGEAFFSTSSGSKRALPKFATFKSGLEEMYDALNSVGAIDPKKEYSTKIQAAGYNPSGEALFTAREVSKDLIKDIVDRKVPLRGENSMSFIKEQYKRAGAMRGVELKGLGAIDDVEKFSKGIANTVDSFNGNDVESFMSMMEKAGVSAYDFSKSLDSIKFENVYDIYKKVLVGGGNVTPLEDLSKKPGYSRSLRNFDTAVRQVESLLPLIEPGRPRRALHQESVVNMATMSSPAYDDAGNMLPAAQKEFIKDLNMRFNDLMAEIEYHRNNPDLFGRASQVSVPDNIRTISTLGLPDSIAGTGPENLKLWTNKVPSDMQYLKALDSVTMKMYTNNLREMAPFGEQFQQWGRNISSVTNAIASPSSTLVDRLAVKGADYSKGYAFSETPSLKTERERSIIDSGRYGLSGYGFNALAELRTTSNTFEDQVVITGKLADAVTAITRTLIKPSKGGKFSKDQESINRGIGVGEIQPGIKRNSMTIDEASSAIQEVFGIVDKYEGRADTALVGDVKKTLAVLGGKDVEVQAAKLAEVFINHFGRKITTRYGSKGVGITPDMDQTVVDSLFKELQRNNKGVKVLTKDEAANAGIGVAETPKSMGELLSEVFEKEDLFKKSGIKKEDLVASGNKFIIDMFKDSGFGLVTDKEAESNRKLFESVNKALGGTLSSDIKGIEEIKDLYKSKVGPDLLKQTPIDISISAKGMAKRGLQGDILEAIMNNVIGANDTTSTTINTTLSKQTYSKLLGKGSEAGLLSKYSEKLGYKGPDESDPNKIRELLQGGGMDEAVAQRAAELEAVSKYYSTVLEQGPDGLNSRKGLVGRKFFSIVEEPHLHPEWSKEAIAAGVKGEQLNIPAYSAYSTIFGENSAMMREINKSPTIDSKEHYEYFKALQTINKDNEEAVKKILQYLPKVELSDISSDFMESTGRMEAFENTVLDTNKFPGAFNLRMPSTKDPYKKVDFYVPSAVARGKTEEPLLAGEYRPKEVSRRLLKVVEAARKLEMRTIRPTELKSDIGKLESELSNTPTDSPEYGKIYQELENKNKSLDFYKEYTASKSIDELRDEMIGVFDNRRSEAMAAVHAKDFDTANKIIDELSELLKGEQIQKGYDEGPTSKDAFAHFDAFKKRQIAVMNKKPETVNTKYSAILGRLSDMIIGVSESGSDSAIKKAEDALKAASSPDQIHKAQSNLDRNINRKKAISVMDSKLLSGQGSDFAVNLGVRDKKTMDEEIAYAKAELTRAKIDYYDTLAKKTLGKKGSVGSMVFSRKIPAATNKAVTASVDRSNELRAFSMQLRAIAKDSDIPELSTLGGGINEVLLSHQDKLTELKKKGLPILKQHELGIPESMAKKLPTEFTKDWVLGDNAVLEKAKDPKKGNNLYDLLDYKEMLEKNLPHSSSLQDREDIKKYIDKDLAPYVESVRFPFTGISSVQPYKPTLLRGEKDQNIIMAPGVPEMDMNKFDTIIERISGNGGIIDSLRDKRDDTDYGSNEWKSLTTTIEELERAVSAVIPKYIALQQKLDFDGDTLEVHSATTKEARNDIRKHFKMLTSDVDSASAIFRDSFTYDEARSSGKASSPFILGEMLASFDKKFPAESGYDFLRSPFLTKQLEYIQDEDKLGILSTISNKSQGNILKGVIEDFVTASDDAKNRLMKIVDSSENPLNDLLNTEHGSVIKGGINKRLFEDKYKSAIEAQLYKIHTGSETEAMYRVHRLAESNVGFGGGMINPKEGYDPEQVFKSRWPKGNIAYGGQPEFEFHTMMNEMLRFALQKGMDVKHAGQGTVSGEMVRQLSKGRAGAESLYDTIMDEKNKDYGDMRDFSAAVDKSIRRRLDKASNQSLRLALKELGRAKGVEVNSEIDTGDLKADMNKVKGEIIDLTGFKSFLIEIAEQIREEAVKQLVESTKKLPDAKKPTGVTDLDKWAEEQIAEEMRYGINISQRVTSKSDPLYMARVAGASPYRQRIAVENSGGELQYPDAVTQGLTEADKKVYGNRFLDAQATSISIGKDIREANIDKHKGAYDNMLSSTINNIREEQAAVEKLIDTFGEHGQKTNRKSNTVEDLFNRLNKSEGIAPGFIEKLGNQKELDRYLRDATDLLAAPRLSDVEKFDIETDSDLLRTNRAKTELFSEGMQEGDDNYQNNLDKLKDKYLKQAIALKQFDLIYESAMSKLNEGMVLSNILPSEEGFTPPMSSRRRPTGSATNRTPVDISGVSEDKSSVPKLGSDECISVRNCGANPLMVYIVGSEVPLVGIGPKSTEGSDPHGYDEDKAVRDSEAIVERYRDWLRKNSDLGTVKDSMPYSDKDVPYYDMPDSAQNDRPIDINEIDEALRYAKDNSEFDHKAYFASMGEPPGFDFGPGIEGKFNALKAMYTRAADDQSNERIYGKGRSVNLDDLIKELGKSENDTDQRLHKALKDVLEHGDVPGEESFRSIMKEVSEPGGEDTIDRKRLNKLWRAYRLAKGKWYINEIEELQKLVDELASQPDKATDAKLTYDKYKNKVNSFANNVKSTVGKDSDIYTRNNVFLSQEAAKRAGVHLSYEELQSIANKGFGGNAEMMDMFSFITGQYKGDNKPAPPIVTARDVVGRLSEEPDTLNNVVKFRSQLEKYAHFNLDDEFSVDKRNNLDNVIKLLKEYEKINGRISAREQGNLNTSWGEMGTIKVPSWLSTDTQKSMHAGNVKAVQDYFSKSSEEGGPEIGDRFTYNEKILNSTGQVVKAVAHDFHKYGEYVNKAGIAVGAFSEKQRDLSELMQGGHRGLKSVFGRVIRWGAASKLVWGSVSALKNSISTISDLETGMAQLRMVMNPLQSDFEGLQNTALNFAKDYGVPTQDVLKSMKIFAQQGLKQADVIDRTKTATLAANVTTLNAYDATEALTAATKIYGSEGGKAIKFLDSWSEVESRHAITAADMANALKKSASAAKNAGVDFDQLNGIIAAIGSTTRQSGKEVGTSLRFIFRRLTSEKGPQALGKIGIPTMTPEGDLRSGFDILGDLSSQWDNLTRAQKMNIAQAIGGTRQYNSLLVLMDNWGEALRGIQSSINSKGSAERRNLELMKTYEKQLEQTKAAATELQVAFGKIYLPIAKTGLKATKVLLETITALPTWVKAAATAMSVFVTYAAKGNDIIDSLSKNLSKGGNLFGSFYGEAVKNIKTTGYEIFGMESSSIDTTTLKRVGVEDKDKRVGGYNDLKSPISKMLYTYMDAGKAFNTFVGEGTQDMGAVGEYVSEKLKSIGSTLSIFAEGIDNVGEAVAGEGVKGIWKGGKKGAFSFDGLKDYIKNQGLDAIGIKEAFAAEKGGGLAAAAKVGGKTLLSGAALLTEVAGAGAYGVGALGDIASEYMGEGGRSFVESFASKNTSFAKAIAPLTVTLVAMIPVVKSLLAFFDRLRLSAGDYAKSMDGLRKKQAEELNTNIGIGSSYSNLRNRRNALNKYTSDDYINRKKELGTYRSPVFEMADIYKDTITLSNELAESNSSMVIGYDELGNAVLRTTKHFDNYINTVSKAKRKEMMKTELDIASKYVESLSGSDDEEKKYRWKQIIDSAPIFGQMLSKGIDVGPGQMTKVLTTQLNDLFAEKSKYPLTTAFDEDIKRLQGKLKEVRALYEPMYKDFRNIISGIDTEGFSNTEITDALGREDLRKGYEMATLFESKYNVPGIKGTVNWQDIYGSEVLKKLYPKKGNFLDATSLLTKETAETAGATLRTDKIMSGDIVGFSDEMAKKYDIAGKQAIVEMKETTDGVFEWVATYVNSKSLKIEERPFNDNMQKMVDFIIPSDYIKQETADRIKSLREFVSGAVAGINGIDSKDFKREFNLGPRFFSDIDTSTLLQTETGFNPVNNKYGNSEFKSGWDSEFVKFYKKPMEDYNGLIDGLEKQMLEGLEEGGHTSLSTGLYEDIKELQAVLKNNQIVLQMRAAWVDLEKVLENSHRALMTSISLEEKLVKERRGTSGLMTNISKRLEGIDYGTTDYSKLNSDQKSLRNSKSYRKRAENILMLDTAIANVRENRNTILKSMEDTKNIRGSYRQLGMEIDQADFDKYSKTVAVTGDSGIASLRVETSKVVDNTAETVLKLGDVKSSIDNLVELSGGKSSMGRYVDKLSQEGDFIFDPDYKPLSKTRDKYLKTDILENLASYRDRRQEAGDTESAMAANKSIDNVIRDLITRYGFEESRVAVGRPRLFRNFSEEEFVQRAFGGIDMDTFTERMRAQYPEEVSGMGKFFGKESKSDFDVKRSELKEIQDKYKDTVFNSSDFIAAAAASSYIAHSQKGLSNKTISKLEERIAMLDENIASNEKKGLGFDNDKLLRERAAASELLGEEKNKAELYGLARNITFTSAGMMSFAKALGATESHVKALGAGTLATYASLKLASELLGKEMPDSAKEFGRGLGEAIKSGKDFSKKQGIELMDSGKRMVADYKEAVVKNAPGVKEKYLGKNKEEFETLIDQQKVREGIDKRSTAIKDYRAKGDEYNTFADMKEKHLSEMMKLYEEKGGKLFGTDSYRDLRRKQEAEEFSFFTGIDDKDKRADIKNNYPDGSMGNVYDVVFSQEELTNATKELTKELGKGKDLDTNRAKQMAIAYAVYSIAKYSADRSKEDTLLSTRGAQADEESQFINSMTRDRFMGDKRYEHVGKVMDELYAENNTSSAERNVQQTTSESQLLDVNKEFEKQMDSYKKALEDLSNKEALLLSLREVESATQRLVLSLSDLKYGMESIANSKAVESEISNTKRWQQLVIDRGMQGFPGEIQVKPSMNKSFQESLWHSVNYPTKLSKDYNTFLPDFIDSAMTKVSSGIARAKTWAFHEDETNVKNAMEAYNITLPKQLEAAQSQQAYIIEKRASLKNSLSETNLGEQARDDLITQLDVLDDQFEMLGNGIKRIIQLHAELGQAFTKFLPVLESIHNFESSLRDVNLKERMESFGGLQAYDDFMSRQLGGGHPSAAISITTEQEQRARSVGVDLTHMGSSKFELQKSELLYQYRNSRDPKERMELMRRIRYLPDDEEREAQAYEQRKQLDRLQRQVSPYRSLIGDLDKAVMFGDFGDDDKLRKQVIGMRDNLIDIVEGSTKTISKEDKLKLLESKKGELSESIYESEKYNIEHGGKMQYVGTLAEGVYGEDSKALLEESRALFEKLAGSLPDEPFVKDMKEVFDPINTELKLQTAALNDIKDRIAAVNNPKEKEAGFFSNLFGGSEKEKKASGGLIVGPGGPKTDSIPAMLSNGEYVVKASSVNKLGLGALEYLNKNGKLPAFANGGIVSEQFSLDKLFNLLTGKSSDMKPEEKVRYFVASGDDFQELGKKAFESGRITDDVEDYKYEKKSLRGADGVYRVTAYGDDYTFHSDEDSFMSAARVNSSSKTHSKGVVNTRPKKDLEKYKRNKELAEALRREHRESRDYGPEDLLLHLNRVMNSKADITVGPNAPIGSEFLPSLMISPGSNAMTYNDAPFGVGSGVTNRGGINGAWVDKNTQGYINTFASRLSRGLNNPMDTLNAINSAKDKYSGNRFYDLVHRNPVATSPIFDPSSPSTVMSSQRDVASKRVLAYKGNREAKYRDLYTKASNGDIKAYSELPNDLQTTLIQKRALMSIDNKKLFEKTFPSYGKDVFTTIVDDASTQLKAIEQLNESIFKGNSIVFPNSKYFRSFESIQKAFEDAQYIVGRMSIESTGDPNALALNSSLAAYEAMNGVTGDTSKIRSLINSGKFKEASNAFSKLSKAATPNKDRRPFELPKYHTGGVVDATGPALLEKGEIVIPKSALSESLASKSMLNSIPKIEIKIDTEGITVPVDVGDAKVPIDVADKSVEVNTEGIKLPVDVEGISIPVDVEDKKVSVNTDGVMIPLDYESIKIPIDIGDVKVPIAFEDVKIPVDLSEKIKVDIEGIKLPVALDGVSIPVDIGDEKVGVAIDGLSIPVDIADAKVPVDVSNSKVSVDTEGVLLSVDTSKKIEVNTEGILLPVDTTSRIDVNVEGLTIPVDIAGLSIPVDIDNKSLPVNIEGLSIPVDASGIVIPVDTADIKIPIDIEGITIPVNTEGVKVGVDTEGLSIPVDINNARVPVDVEGLKIPVDVDNVRIPIDIDGLSIPVDTNGVSVPVDISGLSELINSAPKNVGAEGMEDRLVTIIDSMRNEIADFGEAAKKYTDDKVDILNTTTSLTYSLQSRMDNIEVDVNELRSNTLGIESSVRRITAYNNSKFDSISGDIDVLNTYNKRG